jgi:hypothetical protein
MKNKPILVTWFFLVVFPYMVSAQKTFTVNELKTIDQTVDSIMNLYSQYSLFSSDMETLSDEYIEGFRDLFISPSAEIVNDLDADIKKKTPAKISVNTYIEYIRKWYSKGVGVNVTVLQKIAPRFVNQKYLLSIRASKELVGFYKNQQPWKYKGEQYLTIAFDEKLTEFKIQAIDLKGGTDTCEKWRNIAKTYFGKKDCKQAKTAYNKLLDLCPSDIDAITAKIKCDSCIEANKKPVFLVLHVLPGFSGINLKSGSELESFSSKSDFNFEAGIGVEVGLVKGIKGLLSAGLLFDIATYNSTMNLGRTDYTIPDLFDYDNDKYNLICNIHSLEEMDNLMYFQIPLYIKYEYGFSPFLSLYGKLGGKAGFNLSKKYTSNGIGEYKGQYPDKFGGVILYGNDLPPEYGFGTYNLSVDSTNNFVNNINISGFVGLGIDLKLSGKLDLFLGVEYTQGVTNINSTDGQFYISQGKNSVNSLYGTSKTTTHAFGVDVGVRYKLIRY